jgi:[FeFe] hydrogenase H-cluster maturation GTPase HydF
MSRERRPHIGIYGRRNVGKSTLTNDLTGQQTAIVSDTPGTTTDPVKKSVELTGFGPVILIDTAGIDDHGELGKKRIEKTTETIKIIDLAILVIASNTFGEAEKLLIADFNRYDIPFIAIHNKEDLQPLTESTKEELGKFHPACIISHRSGSPANAIISSIKNAIPSSAYTLPSMLGKIISPGDTIVMITPIDSSAPEGRMILPQVQAIRDALDNDAVCVVMKENQIESFFKKNTIRPRLVVTDSQAFAMVSKAIPEDIPLTSFSILLANFKGDFDAYLEGTPHLSKLQKGDRVLILESCTHHVSCDDIGRIKLPAWINKFTGLTLDYEIVAGLSPIPTKQYAMVIQCGGCMITRKQLIGRLKPFRECNIPISNYGMTIAYINGIFERAVKPFQ